MANKEDEIKQRIKESIDKIDFYTINENVGDVANKAWEQMTLGLEQTADYVSKGVDKWAEKVKSGSETTTEKKQNVGHTPINKATANPYSYTTQSPYYQNPFRAPKEQPLCVPPSGKILGPLLMWLGGIFSFFIAMMFLVTCAAGIPAAGVLFMPLALISGGMAIWGSKLSKRYKRYLSYIRTLNGKPYGKIDRLAKAIGKNKKYTLQDIREMIRDGVFPTGQISDEDDYLMLTHEVYREYLALKRDMEQKHKKEKMTKKEKRTELAKMIEESANEDRNENIKEQKEVVDEQTKKVQAAVQIGREYSRQIELANDIIETQEFSDKLFRLQLLVEKIFYCVEQNPKKLPEIKQLMDYYLPTTLKLVNAYRDFYLQPVQGENITAAKAEIEKAIDTINIGFENLLDDLYKQDALDISSDIYVLENMLAREGLTENEFEKMKSGGL